MAVGTSQSLIGEATGGRTRAREDSPPVPRAPSAVSRPLWDRGPNRAHPPRSSRDDTLFIHSLDAYCQVLTWALAIREQALDCLLDPFPPSVGEQTPCELSCDAGIQALAGARNLKHLLLRISVFWGVKPCGSSRQTGLPRPQVRASRGGRRVAR